MDTIATNFLITAQTPWKKFQALESGPRRLMRSMLVGSLPKQNCLYGRAEKPERQKVQPFLSDYNFQPKRLLVKHGTAQCSSKRSRNSTLNLGFVEFGSVAL